MKQRSLTLLLLMAALSAFAKDGGLILAGSVAVSESDDGEGGFSTTSHSTTTNLFDKHGNLIETVTLSYFNGDGIPAAASTNTLFYDQRGNLAQYVEAEPDANFKLPRPNNSIPFVQNPWLASFPSLLNFCLPSVARSNLLITRLGFV